MELDIGGSITNLCDEHFGVRTSKSRRRTSGFMLPAQLCRLLEVSTGKVDPGSGLWLGRIDDEAQSSDHHLSTRFHLVLHFRVTLGKPFCRNPNPRCYQRNEVASNWCSLLVHWRQVLGDSLIVFGFTVLGSSAPRAVPFTGTVHPWLVYRGLGYHVLWSPDVRLPLGVGRDPTEGV